MIIFSLVSWLLVELHRLGLSQSLEDTFAPWQKALFCLGAELDMRAKGSLLIKSRGQPWGTGDHPKQNCSIEGGSAPPCTISVI